MKKPNMLAHIICDESGNDNPDSFRYFSGDHDNVGSEPAQDAKKVKFVESSSAQVHWGSNDNPFLYLEKGQTYSVLREEVHSWHTKLVLTNFPNQKFNSISFEPVK